jgi:hypothetical protein
MTLMEFTRLLDKFATARAVAQSEDTRGDVWRTADDLGADVVEEYERLLSERSALRAVVAEVASMLDRFDTPSDPGRVRALVGDLRQIVAKEPPK